MSYLHFCFRLSIVVSNTSAWPDFVDPEVRKWWQSKFMISEYEGSTNDLHTWNDMNEPSVFNGPEISFHRDVKHHFGWENRDVHNIYGHYVELTKIQILRYKI
jgi:alpha 1,3-glucosidase